MNTRNTLPIRSLALANYRSFGKNPQNFPVFSKINIFIGKNNCGKSNILKFIHEWLACINQRKRPNLGDYDRHFPNSGGIIDGYRIDTSLDAANSILIHHGHVQNESHLIKIPTQNLHKILENKKALDNDEFGAWLHFDENGKIIMDAWLPAFENIADHQIQNLWSKLTGKGSGDRNRHWIPEIIERLNIYRQTFKAEMIPAIRKVGAKGSESDDFSGEGLIERLARLQNPPALHQEDKIKFRNIAKFLKIVTDNPTAEIEIPHNRDTILVHLNDRVLPLESLGSGIHEVIILASASTILDNHVICMEEPELHLNPILQKKLVRYLQEATNNQYFITTHSASLMDTPGAEVYHIELRNGASSVDRVSSDNTRSRVCEDLGYHPSDLLQTNCVIWVEGPSDRTYLNWWIKGRNPELIEGIHYSVMFYGGRLASHLSCALEEKFIEDFISLRRLNRRGVILIDSDKASKNAKINNTKKRLRDDFNVGPGFAWITEGREIENYIPPEILKEAIRAVHPHAVATTSLDKFENCLKIKTRGGINSQASKTQVATRLTTQNRPMFDRFDLAKQIDKLINFIHQSNPKFLPSKR